MTFNTWSWTVSNATRFSTINKDHQRPLYKRTEASHQTANFFWCDMQNTAFQPSPVAELHRNLHRGSLPQAAQRRRRNQPNQGDSGHWRSDRSPGNTWNGGTLWMNQYSGQWSPNPKLYPIAKILVDALHHQIQEKQEKQRCNKTCGIYKKGAKHSAKGWDMLRLERHPWDIKHRLIILSQGDCFMEFRVEGLCHITWLQKNKVIVKKNQIKTDPVWILKPGIFKVNAKATCCSCCIMMSLCPPHMTSFSDNADLVPMLAWPTEFGIGRTLNSDSNTPSERCWNMLEAKSQWQDLSPTKANQLGQHCERASTNRLRNGRRTCLRSSRASPLATLALTVPLQFLWWDHIGQSFGSPSQLRPIQVVQDQQEWLGCFC